MKQSFITYCLLILITAFVGYACKKSKNDNPFGNAKIATAIISNNGSIENYQFFYGASNNIDSVSITGSGSSYGHNGYLKYSYIGSSWTVTDQNGYGFMVWANTAGQLLKVLVADTLTFTYNNNMLTVQNEYATSATPPYYVNTPTYYTWLNGDVTKTESGTLNQTYTYNTSKNGQPGDPIRIAGFLAYGVSAIKTNHLVTRIANSSTQGKNYAYTFDNKGRISMLVEVVYNNTLNKHDTTTYAYTYY